MWSQYPFLLARHAVKAIVSFVLFTAVLVSAMPIAHASGTISGIVFRDYNGNGARDTREPGFGGVLVRVFDSSGAIQGTDTTYAIVCAAPSSPVASCNNAGSPALGSYSVNAGGTGPYRVEFVNLPSYVKPGARSTDSVGGGTATSSGTTVQFVNDGNTSNVNLAVNDPSDYCQSNPRVATNCHAFGDQNFSTATLLSQDYSATGTSGTTRQEESNANQIGTTWGLAYRRSSNTLYASAFLKRNAGFGPCGIAGSDCSGSIYKITPNGAGANNGTLLVDIDNALGGDQTGNNLHSAFSCGAGGSCDASAFANIGKASFGDLQLSNDETKLWVVNLFNKHLVQVGNLDGSPTVTDLGEIPAPNPICTNGNARPFGLGLRNGNLYIGGVCDAAGGTAADLRAYVLEWVPGANVSTATQVLSFTLNFDRRCGDYAYPSPAPFCNSPTNSIRGLSADWNPWTDTETVIIVNNTTVLGGNQLGYPQPILSDIVFDGEDMLVGFRDRTGDMMGYQDPGTDSTNPLGTTLLDENPNGDILRANPSAYSANGLTVIGWTIENNSASNPTGIFGPTGGANNSQGPGGGEFFAGDNFDSSGAGHDETGLGGIAQLPGAGEAMSTSMDPARFWSGGTWQVSNTNGTRQRSFEYYQYSSGTSAGNRFAKANGLGDVELLCDAAPIELGNRVWNDANGNGIQDPGENPISGVSVRLLDSSNNILSTVVTDANGEFYFSSAAGTDASNIDYGLNIQRNNSYKFRIDPTVGNNATALSGLVLTQANAPDTSAGDGGANAASRDSDAIANGNNSDASFTTGGAGSNNHTIDIGFRPQMDFGDAPDTGSGTSQGNYRTKLSDNGPRHTILSTIQLGPSIDADDGTLQNPTATADNLNNLNDEDSITTFPSLTPSTTSYSLDVKVFNSTGTTATLYAWIDFDRDGVFENGEGVTIANIASDPSTQTKTVTWSNISGIVGGADYFVRVRLTTGTITGGSGGGDPNSTGYAPNGEVEDYRIAATPTALELTTVSAESAPDGTIIVRWETGAELQVLGFNVLRAAKRDGQLVTQNTELIAALTPGQVTGNTYEFTDTNVKPDKTYFYRVQVVRTDNTTEQSEPVQVKTGADTTCQAKPDKAALLTPANDAKANPGKLTFSWEGVTCAATYQVQIRLDSPDGDLVIESKSLTKTQFSTQKLEKGKTYVWRVLACNAGGKCSGSEWWTFKVAKKAQQ